MVGIYVLGVQIYFLSEYFVETGASSSQAASSPPCQMAVA
jgi:hypothetical protein